MDPINGIFEVVGGLFVLLNVVRLHRDKKVRGVSPVAVGFFTVWGWFNLIYYPALGQWYSSLGAGGVAIANTTWLALMVYYTVKERKHDSIPRL
ncbi:MAG: hypothetical protein GY832_31735 [Chloroflexi bacterium]|nr:hypothetical protein [Chloroflexota bacterium]